MRLSDAQLQVLVSMRLNARAPVPAVAKQLRLKQSTVRSALNYLESRSIVEPFALINLSPLGFTEYDITCRLAFTSDAEREKFYRYLSSCKQVIQILKLGGSFQCTFTICAKSPIEVDSLLQTIGSTFGPVCINEAVCVCLRYRIFSPQYLSPKAKLVRSSVTVSTNPYDTAIDETDRLILTSLAHDPKASLREIEMATKIPLATLSRRIRELERRGVFQGYIWQIRPEPFSHSCFRVYISLRGLSAKLKSRLDEFAQEHLNITYLIEWLGSWQYCLGLIVEDSSQATQIVNQVGDILGSAIDQIILVPVIEDIKMKFFPTL